MNINEITTAADLVAFNKAVPEKPKSVIDRVADILVEDGKVFKDNMPIAIFCLENMIRAHHEIAQKGLDGEMDVHPAPWIWDEAVLTAALNLLKSVEQPGDNEDEDIDF